MVSYWAWLVTERGEWLGTVSDWAWWVTGNGKLLGIVSDWAVAMVGDLVKREHLFIKHIT